jgi:cytochrome b561
MGIKNTVESYGTIAKILHWGTAALFLAAYGSYYYRHWFTEEKTPENISALQVRLSIGVTIAVVVVLRVLWRIANRTPDLEPGTKLEHMAAHAGHYALYAIMIIMAITGYLGTGANTNYFFMFEIPQFQNTPIFEFVVNNTLDMTFEEFEKPIDFIHKDVFGAWIVWLLILGHILAALYHHFVKKDRTLKKMTNSKRIS